MKNKLLALAMTTAIMALVVIPSAAMAAESGSTSGTVSVVDSGSLSLTLNGRVATSTFTLGSAVSQDNDNVSNAATDYARVEDYTGNQTNKNGHHIEIELSRDTWYYSGSDADYATRIAVDQDTPDTTASDEMSLQMINTTGSDKTFTALDPLVCNDGATGMTFPNTLTITGTPQVFAYSTSTCNGTSTYQPGSFKVVAPYNGVGYGTYTISGTLTVYDGQDA